MVSVIGSESTTRTNVGAHFVPRSRLLREKRGERVGVELDAGRELDRGHHPVAELGIGHAVHRGSRTTGSQRIRMRSTGAAAKFSPSTRIQSALRPAK